jgi:hypothetical protein
MDEDIKDGRVESPGVLEDASSSMSDGGGTNQNQKILIGLILGFVIIIVALIFGVWFLSIDPERTVLIRDIFIIFMALVTLLVGLLLAILVFQLARLINLLQNEVKPILESTNETVSTLRGTTTFLSNHVTQPIIQLNGYLAAIQRIVELFSLTKGKKK